MNKVKLKQILQAFLIEDIGNADMTSEAIFPEGEVGEGVFTAKAEGVLAGGQMIAEVYRLLTPQIHIDLLKSEGEWMRPGERIATVTGPIRHILTGERLILNLMQRMSGIATMTHRSVVTLNDASITITDTRKTTPGLGMLEKYAVTVGGGKNHRKGLYDGIMIKDNHIAFAGSIQKAVDKAKAYAGHMVNIEVETETKTQVAQAIEAGADVIMFDNRTPDEVGEFVKMVPKSITTEASGGISLDNLASYRGTGVDNISLGFLTHSVKALDISLNVTSS